ncbi:hypothetical protein [Chryseobacterium kwangjuense]|uniref:Uncharacterized protein n=1 Tax=Chryseobacterium kwangjuense TaxID=267125 RepID=A0A135WJQ6_9FLAO|nr:hypothetical protein [Chryseobacterium kwangjuense]KXH85136.1 hypothetical protein AU378_05125 [Chryseobacterium kwangjuense]
MNWIIRSTRNTKFHTNLHEVLKPIWQELNNYSWILTDLDFMTDDQIPIDFNSDVFFLSREQFEQAYKSKTQFIWGIIAAVLPKDVPDIKVISELSAEDPEVWKSDHFLISQAVVEITALDSSYTIIKFTDKKISDLFKEYFKEQALNLQEFAEES